MSPQDRVQEFMKEVEADLFNQFGEVMLKHAPEPLAHLYHYTTIEGLVGIASTKKFFLSDMLASTDQSEIYHGVEVLREVLTEPTGDPIAARFLEQFGDDKLWWGIGKKVFVHAICFCEKSDVLTQWRGYTPNGGVAIGFNFSGLMDRAIAGKFSLGRMLYHRDAQRDFMRHIFYRGRQHLEQLMRLIATVPLREHPQILDDLLVLVSQSLLHLVLLCKDPAFASEEEWRVSTMNVDDRPSDSLKFRWRGTAIIPYIELPFDPLLITEIRCSPGTWSRSALYAIERLAKSLGDHVQVTKSDLPVG